MSGPYREPGRVRLSAAEEMRATTEKAKTRLESAAYDRAIKLLPRVLDLLRVEANTGKTEAWVEGLVSREVRDYARTMQYVIQLLAQDGFVHKRGSCSLGWITWGAE